MSLNLCPCCLFQKLSNKILTLRMPIVDISMSIHNTHTSNFQEVFSVYTRKVNISAVSTLMPCFTLFLISSSIELLDNINYFGRYPFLIHIAARSMVSKVLWKSTVESYVLWVVERLVVGCLYEQCWSSWH